MSFSVVAGGQDQANGNSNLSPFAAAFMSRSGGGSAPNSANAGTRSAGGGGMPPPFSLSAAGGGGGGGGGTPGGSIAHLPDDALFQNQKRIGTDPSKFKTTICRNWEQTGICSFRGCTFAHGVDDLRPPMRATQPPQTVGTPNNGGKKSPSTSPTLQASAAHNGGGNAAPTRLDKLIEMLSLEVSKDKDLVLVHQEAYRTLEAMLRREHTLYDDAHNKLEGTKLKVGLFIKKLREKDAALQHALGIAKTSDVSVEVRRGATTMNQTMESVIAQAQGETLAILADQEDALGAEGKRGPGPSSYSNEGNNWDDLGRVQHQDIQQQQGGYKVSSPANETGLSSRTDSNAADSTASAARSNNPSGLSYAAAAGKRGTVKPPTSIGLQPIDALCDDDEDYAY